MADKQPTIALIWAQFSAYHVDRLQAVGQRLAGRARVYSVEVSSKSAVYAWAPSNEVKGTEKIRLFADARYEDIHFLKRWAAMFRATRKCDTVYIGIGYNEPDALLLGLTLRLAGVRVIMMTASKWDDRPRRSTFELIKMLLLSPFSAALVGGARQMSYVRFLGFRRRQVLPGYNTVDIERIRLQAHSIVGERKPAFHERAFIYVGRFVTKKLLHHTLNAYAAYVRQAGPASHRLEMIGSGELEGELRAQCDQLGISHLVDWPGFLDAPDVAARLAHGLALVLVSREEQWGLVINEALAVGLPVIASAQVGAREALVRNLENGFVVEPGSEDGLTRAMLTVAESEAGWEKLSQAAQDRAWLGDTQRFADAVELYTFPDSTAVAERHARFEAAISPLRG
ncbi:glycosyltransferase [Novosphingobium sp.]|uniref:glycosyltransferase n=1 Tax=Novosphingobium sp. TaxID=1874826 RepID=UPI00273279D5|nr:glycosyltransferase [Novosphingobium sp.]MDP3906640.1 glycosyltransferase [Novosphingobium sp.]